MTSPRHQHTTRTDEAGRDICTVCSQIVTKPILSSDDPRLVDAGLHRSGGKYIPEEELYVPLPTVLIALYHNGPALGLQKAPIAPFVDMVAQEMGQRFAMGQAVGPDLWDDLYRKCLSHGQSNKDKQGR